MERDLYPRRWGLGPVALEKKKLKSDGKLDKFGRPNEATPAKWTAGYKDFNAPLGTETAAPAAVEAIKEEPKEEVKPEPASPEKKSEDADDKKKRKKHDGETPEEKAERKRLKKEKKARKSLSGDKDESD